MRQIDGKYKTDGNVTKLDGTPIPEGEPLILFRGQDKLLPELLQKYNELCKNAGSPQEQLDKLAQQIEKIKQWQAVHPDKLKTPD